MKKYPFLILILLIFGCSTYGKIFGGYDNITISNDLKTLGLIGSDVLSSDLKVATATITPDKIKISSISGGMVTITVFDELSHKTSLDITVSDTGYIKINSIVKCSENSELQLSRFDLENDMYLPHEGTPAGVPDDFWWKKWPSVSYRNNVPERFDAIIPWGQVYPEQSQPNPDIDFPLIRVQIKDIQLYAYQNDGSWKLVVSKEDPYGFLYIEDYNNDFHKEADIWNEANNGGGISVQAGSGFNFHFFSNRAIIEDKNDLHDIFVVCKARLLGTEYYKTPSKYILNLGSDYWKDLDSEWAPDDLNNTGVAIGRFKFLTPNWQYFTMHTFPQNEVKNIVFPLEK